MASPGDPAAVPVAATVAPEGTEPGTAVQGVVIGDPASASHGAAPAPVEGKLYPGITPPADSNGAPNGTGKSPQRGDSRNRGMQRSPRNGVMGWDWKKWKVDFTRYRDAAEAEGQAAHGSTSENYFRMKNSRRRVADHNYQMLRELRYKPPQTQKVLWSKVSEFLEKNDYIKQMATKRPRGKITFSRTFTDGACRYFVQKEGRRVCGMNFANGTSIGGGYVRGAKAQEEDLCRQFPAYFSSMNRTKDRNYPFGPPAGKAGYADLLYTGGVECMRDDEEGGYRMLEDAERFRCAFVAAAAPNVASGQDIFDEKRIQLAMINLLYGPHLVDQQLDVLVLGAWGCGAFGCDNEVMAKLFAQVINSYAGLHVWKEIHFAIPVFANSRNDQIYFDVLKGQFPEGEFVDKTSAMNDYLQERPGSNPAAVPAGNSGSSAGGKSPAPGSNRSEKEFVPVD